MIEIKFRAKVKGDAGLWNVWKIDWLNQQIELDGARGGLWTPMEKIQGLMQFTGLLDKNGKEIYEGDNILLEDTFTDVVTDDGRGPTEPANHLCPVVFLNGTFGLDVQEKGNTYHIGFFSFGDIANIAGIFPDELEVIGNIYEHSDLLK